MVVLKILGCLVCLVITVPIGLLGLMVLYRNSGPKMVFTCRRCRAVEKHYVRNVDERAAALAICPRCNGSQAVHYEN